jgi:hypothetical protein
MYTLSSLTQQEMLDAKIRYPTPGKVQVLLLALTLNYEVFPCLLVGWFSFQGDSDEEEEKGAGDTERRKSQKRRESEIIIIIIIT